MSSTQQRNRTVTLTRSRLARLIDHTQVRAYATQTDINELCDEAVQHGFGAVCVNSVWTSYAARRLADTNVAICVTVGFPLGATTAHIKVEEAKEAIRNGADEIDMVINIGALKSGFPKFVEKEVAAVIRAVEGTPVKVILETGYLSESEKLSVCQIAVSTGAAYVKTCTGFGQSGATVEDVKLMRSVVGRSCGVKAAGGVRGYRDAIAMIEAGANRLGTSSGIEILEEMPQEHE